MSLQQLIYPFPWAVYGQKLTRKICRPCFAGYFDESEAKERKLRLAVGKAGLLEDGNFITLYWLLDPQDGVIIDCRFQVFGQSALIGGAEIACEILSGKNYDQAKRLSADLLEQQVQEKGKKRGFPPETYPHLNLVLEAIDHAAMQCTDIPFALNYVAPPKPLKEHEGGDGYPGWESLEEGQKIAVIEEVLNSEVRPYIAMDAGGIEVLELTSDFQLKIAYQGNCTSCLSSVGATLSFIQHTLRSRVCVKLTVIPQLT